jgi:hypothetical protein
VATSHKALERKRDIAFSQLAVKGLIMLHLGRITKQFRFKPRFLHTFPRWLAQVSKANKTGQTVVHKFGHRSIVFSNELLPFMVEQSHGRFNLQSVKDVMLFQHCQQAILILCTG